MQPYLRAPIFAYRLLAHDRSRSLASIGGVAFALVLMMMQVGFRNSLLDSGLQLMERLDADVIVISKEKFPFLRMRSMPRERLYQALATEGAESVAPLWTGLARWTNPYTRTMHPIRILGFDPRKPTFEIESVNRMAEGLDQPGAALLDRLSRDSYGSVGTGPAVVNRKEVEVIGTFPLGTDFQVEGTLLVSETTFFELQGWGHEMVEAALVQTEPGADPREIAAAMQATLPDDVVALTKSELIARDRSYWESSTPVSLILLVGVTLGFLAGVVISYQILYTEVLDHMAEFATLKAMGYGDRFIQLVVVTEALFLSVVGFLPALVVGSGIVVLLGVISGLPAVLSWGDSFGILTLSVSMCTVASFFALRRVRVLAPAELF